VAAVNRAVTTGQDTSGAITKAWNGTQLMADVQAQARITAAFGSTASKGWGEYANQQQLKATTAEEAACWGPDGACRVAGHTVIGGLAGGIGGAVGAGTGTILVPAIADAVKKSGLTGPAADALITAIVGGLGAATGGAAGSVGAFNEVTNNYLTSKQWQAYADELSACRTKVTGCSTSESQAIRNRWAAISVEQNIKLTNCVLAICDLLSKEIAEGTSKMIELAGAGAIPGGAAQTDLGQFLGQKLATDASYRAEVQAALAVAAACNRNPGQCTQQAMRVAGLALVPLLGAAYGTAAVGLLVNTGRMAVAEAALVVQLGGVGNYCGLKPDTCLLIAETAFGISTGSIAPSVLPAGAIRTVTTVAEAFGGTAATTTAKGFVNATKVCEFGCALTGLTATEQAMVQQIVRNGDQSGQVTEQLLVAVSNRTGMTVLAGGKYGTDNGFDLVLKSPEGMLTIVLDGKQMAEGAFKLTSDAAGGAVQLSDQWIQNVLLRLPSDDPAKIAVQAAIRAGTLQVAVAGVNKSTGALTIVPIVVP
jgi:filamentous hemagglutinin